MDRLRIVIEFSRKSIDDLKLYGELIKFSSPPNHVKDVLKGLAPIPILDKEDK